jgi:ATP-dependent helicase/nuclease subunit A
VRALRSRAVAVPASQQDGAVRLLTIHGAKGLEARVVFLMDAQAEAPKAETMSLLVDWPVHAPQPRRAAFVASHARCPLSLQPLLADELAARGREEVNLLYVALTRAQEQLFVSRTPARASQEAQPSWWTRLLPLSVAWAPAQALAAGTADLPIDVVALPRPRRVPSPPPVMPPVDIGDAAAAALGQAVHRTLEWAARDAAADVTALATAAAAEFAVGDAQQVQEIARRVLDSPACRRFFDARALVWAGNEVAVVSPSGALRRIDRLVLTASPERCWWVLDYKLSRSPQGDAALLAQLDDYRQAVAALVPGEPVRAAFVTAAGELVELPG